MKLIIERQPQEGVSAFNRQPLSMTWKPGAYLTITQGSTEVPDRPMSSFDIPTRPDPQAQTVGATRANQDDRGRIGLLSHGGSRAIYTKNYYSLRLSSGRHSYVIPGLIPIIWPCGSDMDFNDIGQARHSALSHPNSPRPAAPRSCADIEHQEDNRETPTGPNQHRLAVRKLPLTRRDNRRTFTKSQPMSSQNHSARQARAPPLCWVTKASICGIHELNPTGERR